MLKRNLVTTADERTWSNNQPVLFLGEWCKKHSRKSVWENMDSVTVPYHWDDRRKLKKDFKDWQVIHENLLIELAEQLNSLHKTDHSTGYWRVLIGPWLLVFVQIVFDRWFMLKKAIEDYDPGKCFILDSDYQTYVPENMEHFLKLATGERWNQAIYSDLLTLFFKNQLQIETISACPREDLTEHTKGSFKNYIKTAISKGMNVLNRITSKPTNYFFIHTYLPIRKEWILQRRLGQFPNIWRLTSKLKNTAHKARTWKLAENKNNNEFDRVIRIMIPRHIPKAYVEGNMKLQNEIARLGWPSNPKVIFTSGAHWTNDSFKLWAATKKEEGVKLVIGQHGGYSGTTNFTSYEDHEQMIADTYISWGWDKKNSNAIKPLGNFKSFLKQVKVDPSGGALLIQFSMTRQSFRIHATPIASQWIYYFENQCKFVSSLPDYLQDEIVVRLYPADFGWEQALRWKDRFPRIKLDKIGQKFTKSLRQNRICIATYNATTFLETLSWNAPTLIYMDPFLWELNHESQPYFDLLKKAGVFHITPESAAKKLTEIWDDVDGWWNSMEVQQARKTFCDRFAAKPPDMMEQLERILRGEMDNQAT